METRTNHEKKRFRSTHEHEIEMQHKEKIISYNGNKYFEQDETETQSKLNEKNAYGDLDEDMLDHNDFNAIMTFLKECKNGRIDRKYNLKYIASSRPNLTMKDENGRNVLHHIVDIPSVNASIEILTDLIDQVMRILPDNTKRLEIINDRDKHGQTPLQIATQNKSNITTYLTKIRENLLSDEKKKIDAQFDSIINSKNRAQLKSFILYANRNSVIQLEPYINQMIERSESDEDLERITECLLELEIEIPKTDYKDKNKMIENIKENYFITDLICSIKNNDLYSFNSLSKTKLNIILHKRIKTGFTIFAAAYLYDNSKILKLLKVEYDIDFTIRNSPEFNNIVYLAIKYDKYDKLQSIIQSGCFNINEKIFEGETPLDFAMHSGNEKIITLLKDAVHDQGPDPINIAAKNENFIVEFSENNGIDVEAKSGSGHSEAEIKMAEEHARAQKIDSISSQDSMKNSNESNDKFKDVVKILQDDKSARFENLIKKDKSLLIQCNDDGKILLMIALESNTNNIDRRIDIIQTIISHRSGFGLKDKNDKNVVHYFAAVKNIAESELISKVNTLVKTLKDKGLSILNDKDKDGKLLYNQL